MKLITYITYVIFGLFIICLAVRLSIYRNTLYNVVDEVNKLKSTISVSKEVQKDKEEVYYSFIHKKNPKVFPALATIITEGVKEASKKYEIPEVVLLALIDVESDYNYQAVSKVGAIGLTQVYPKVWLNPDNEKENLIALGIIEKKEDLYDPKKNIMAGAFILHRYYTQEKKKGVNNPLEKALTRYFGGTQNRHYEKTCASVGEIVLYRQLTNY